MRKGFIFNHDLCVGCKACIAACMLENKWNFKARNVLTHNPESFLPEPVVNLSIACNHCKDPLCLAGCPSSAYFRDAVTGAVIIEPEKCIGCRYCIWNCPYDAPKIDTGTGIMEKCHFCYQRLREGLEPACSATCPTGALSYGQIPEEMDHSSFGWIPEKKINPSLQLTGHILNQQLKIIPEPINEFENITDKSVRKSIGGEWSLVAFTFISTISVALNLAGYDFGYGTARLIPLLIAVFAGLCSLFHLKVKIMLWRSVLNVLRSPLSREISLYVVYTLLIAAAYLFDTQSLRIFIAATGLLLLVAIDAVYTYSARTSFMIFHSGQTFLTGLLMTSFVMNALIPFLLVALIKLIFNFVLLLKARKDNFLFVVRFVRVALLVISAMILIIGSEVFTTAAYAVFLTGELLDRVFYYLDFEPANVKNSIIEPLISSKYEKKNS